MRSLFATLVSLAALADFASAGTPVAGGSAAAPAAPAVAPAPVARVVPENFLPQLSAQLVEHYHLEQQLQLDVLNAWSAPATPAAEWEMRVVAPPAQLRSQNIVRVRLVSAGRTLGEWNLAVQAHLWAEALVLKQGVARGEPLDASYFELRRTDFLRERDAVAATAELDGYAPKRALDAGSPLAWRDLEKRPLVLRGQQVEVTATDGALSISMKALALQNGALGDSITVRNPDSRRDFSGTVTGTNRVRVSF